jgi:hypothetical protein
VLLGRWTLIAERHAGGCSCCPSLGEVGMEEVEARVLAWLSGRHAGLSEKNGFTKILRDCIASPSSSPQQEALFNDIGEALEDLERMQSGIL